MNTLRMSGRPGLIALLAVVSASLGHAQEAVPFAPEENPGLALSATAMVAGSTTVKSVGF